MKKEALNGATNTIKSDSSATTPTDVASQTNPTNRSRSQIMPSSNTNVTTTSLPLQLGPFKHVSEIWNRPFQKWLVEGILTEESVAVMFGYPATGKSFIAIDLMYSIAYGVPWAGKPVEQGSVFYVVSEGVGGLPVRFVGWQSEKGATLKQSPSFYYIGKPQDFTDPGVVVSITNGMLQAPIKAKLLVIDTYADCFALTGKSENETSGTSAFFISLREIASKTGATVLVIHHTNKGKKEERGSSAMRGMMDTMLFVSQKGNVIELSSSKQKNCKASDRLRWEMKTVDLSNYPNASSGSLSTTCVLIPTDNNSAGNDAPTFSKNQSLILEELRKHPEGIVFGDVLANTGLAKSSVSDALKSLIERDAASFSDRKYYPGKKQEEAGQFGSGVEPLGSPSKPNPDLLQHLTVTPSKAQNEQPEPNESEKPNKVAEPNELEANEQIPTVYPNESESNESEPNRTPEDGEMDSILEIPDEYEDDEFQTIIQEVPDYDENYFEAMEKEYQENCDRIKTSEDVLISSEAFAEADHDNVDDVDNSVDDSVDVF